MNGSEFALAVNTGFTQPCRRRGDSASSSLRCKSRLSFARRSSSKVSAAHLLCSSCNLHSKFLRASVWPLSLRSSQPREFVLPLDPLDRKGWFELRGASTVEVLPTKPSTSLL